MLAAGLENISHPSEITRCYSPVRCYDPAGTVTKCGLIATLTYCKISALVGSYAIQNIRTVNKAFINS